MKLYSLAEARAKREAKAAAEPEAQAPAATATIDLGLPPPADDSLAEAQRKYREVQDRMAADRARDNAGVLRPYRIKAPTPKPRD